jgi:hypothetical protein
METLTQEQAMRGNLQHMAVADLIQHNCQDRKIAQLAIEHNGHEAAIFFKEGAVVHATLDDIQGEEVIYHILSWQDGDFNLEIEGSTSQMSGYAKRNQSIMLCITA